MVYPIVNALLVQSNEDLSAAEAHGMATGLLCVNTQTTSAYWLGELLHESGPITDEDKELLIRLFEETRRLLASDDFDFEFDLLLPDDDELLQEQVVALKNWCRGFLLGVGSARLNADFSAEAHEILKDISEFTKLDSDAEGEEDEGALIEITEYLRSAVLLLRDELSGDAGDCDH